MQLQVRLTMSKINLGKNKFIYCNRLLIFGLLIALNIIIRYPSVLHEIGNDSFSMHILANSINEFGRALWWINKLSVFGLYPYSYASATPFLLSAISQTTGSEIELAIRQLSVLLGILSTFTAYILAAKIWNNDIFKYLLALVFSVSPGILAFTTWDGSTRGVFLISLPLFIYTLLKTQDSPIKFALLTVILFIFLMASHHLFYFTIPIILSYIMATVLSKLNPYIERKLSDNMINLLLGIGLLMMFLYPCITGAFIKITKYYEIYIMAVNNLRYTGILLVYSFIGVAYLLAKKKKVLEEYFLVFFSILFSPLLYIETYAHYFIIIFLCIYISFALTNICIASQRKHKHALVILVISLLVFVSFSGFYQHWRTNMGDEEKSQKWYVDESTYASSLWIKENIDKNKRLISNDNIMSKRMFALSETPFLLGDVDVIMLTYGFADANNTPMHKNSFTSSEYYIDNPYVIQKGFTEIGWYRNSFQDHTINSLHDQKITEDFNLSYVVENTKIEKSSMIDSLGGNNSCVCDNGGIKLWLIGANK